MAKTRLTVVEKHRDKWLSLGGAARADWYAKGVRKGTIPACKTIRQAVDKWFALRKRAKYNKARVDDVVSVIKSMMLPEGKRGVCFEPTPWQCWATSWIYGFETDEGNRLIQQFFITVPRKAGKSSLTACWALYEMVKPWNDVTGAEVAFIGVTLETARIAFSKLRRILTNDASYFGNDGFCAKHEIVNNSTGVKVEKTNAFAYKLTTAGRNIDGITLRMAVIDEIAAMDDNGKIETIRSGMGHDPDSLVILTTTPHDKWASAYDDEKESALQWLSGDVENDKYACVLYRAEMDDLDKEFDMELWEKVQPNLGNTVSLGFYEDAAARAVTTQVNLHRFRTRLLCADSVLAGTWITPVQVEQSGDPPESPRRGDANRWIIGVDTSDVQDMTALCLMGMVDATGEVHVYWDLHVPQSAIPKATTGNKRDADIREWAAKGLLTIHPERVDHRIIAAKITEWHEKFRPLGIYADNHTSMNDAAGRCPPHVQSRIFRRNKTPMSMAEPMGSLSIWVSEGNVKFEKNPACIDHFRNVRILEYRDGTRFPSKPEGNRKIDVVDATLMATYGIITSKDLKIAGTPPAPRSHDFSPDNPLNQIPFVIL